MNERRMSMTLDIGADISKVKIAAQELQNLFKNTSLDPFKTKNLLSMFNGLNDALADLEKRSGKALSSLGEGRGVDASKKRVLSYIQNIAQEFQELEGLGDTLLSKKIKGLSDSLELSSKAFDRYEASMKSTKDLAKDLGKLLETLQDILKKLERLAEIEKDLPNKRRLATRTSNEFDVVAKNLSIALGNKTRTENRYKKYIEENSILLTQKGIPKVLANQKDGITLELIDKANQLYEAYDKAAKAYAELNKDAQNKQDKKDTAAKELTDLENEQKTLKTSLEGVNDTLEETKNKVNQTQEAIKSFNLEGRDTASFEELKKTLKELFGDEIIKDIDNTKEGILTLKDRIENISTDRVKELRKLFPELFNSIKGLGDSALTMGKKVDEGLSLFSRANEASLEISHLASRLKYFFSLAGGFQLMRRAIRSATETTKELDAVMTLTAVVSKFTVGDMWKTLPEYSKYAKQLGTAIKDVYSAQTLYVQQGLSMDKAMDIGIETLKMARVANIDAAEATNSMTAALRGFNMELNETSAQRINDVYSKLAQNTASNTQEISTAMTKTAALANSANMSFENTAAFLATIIESTREGAETAGTALKTVIARFTEVKKLYSEGELLGTDEEGQEVDVNKISAALRTAGINMNDFFTGAKGLDEIFLELGSKWDSLTTVQQRYIATMAAGSRQQSRFLALMQNYNRTVELTLMAYNSAGSGQEQFEKTLDSLQAKIEKFKAEWQTFIMGIANSDAIKGIIDVSTKILEIINKIIDGISGGNGLVKSIASIVTAVGIFKGGRSLTKMIMGGAGNYGLGGIIGNWLGVKNGYGEKQEQVAAFKASMRQGGLRGQRGEFLRTLWFGLGGVLNPKGRVEASKAAIVLAEADAKGYKDAYDKALVQEQKSLREAERSLRINTEEIALEDWDKYDKDHAATEAARVKYEESQKSLDNIKSSATDAGTAMYQYGQAAKTAGMAAGVAAGACMLLATVLDKTGNTKAAKTLRGIGTVLTVLSGIFMVLGQVALITGAQIAAGAKTASTAIMNIPIIGWIAAIIAALIALGVAISNFIETDAEKAQRLAEETENAKQVAELASLAYDDLLSAKSGYDELISQLEGLTKGTIEYKNALYEANLQVLELAKNYKDLEYTYDPETGLLKISEESWNKILERELNRKLSTSAIANLTENRENREKTRLNLDLLKSFYRLSKTFGYSEHNPLNGRTDKGLIHTTLIEGLTDKEILALDKLGYTTTDLLKMYAEATNSKGKTYSELTYNMNSASKLDIEEILASYTSSLKKALSATASIIEDPYKELDTNLQNSLYAMSDLTKKSSYVLSKLYNSETFENIPTIRPNEDRTDWKERDWNQTAKDINGEVIKDTQGNNKRYWDDIIDTVLEEGLLNETEASTLKGTRVTSNEANKKLYAAITGQKYSDIKDKDILEVVNYIADYYTSSKMAELFGIDQKEFETLNPKVQDAFIELSEAPNNLTLEQIKTLKEAWNDIGKIGFDTEILKEYLGTLTDLGSNLGFKTEGIEFGKYLSKNLLNQRKELDLWFNSEFLGQYDDLLNSIVTSENFTDTQKGSIVNLLSNTNIKSLDDLYKVIDNLKEAGIDLEALDNNVYNSLISFAKALGNAGIATKKWSQENAKEAIKNARGIANDKEESLDRKFTKEEFATISELFRGTEYDDELKYFMELTDGSYKYVGPYLDTIINALYTIANKIPGELIGSVGSKVDLANTVKTKKEEYSVNREKLQAKVNQALDKIDELWASGATEEEIEKAEEEYKNALAEYNGTENIKQFGKFISSEDEINDLYKTDSDKAGFYNDTIKNLQKLYGVKDEDLLKAGLSKKVDADTVGAVWLTLLDVLFNSEALEAEAETLRQQIEVNSLIGASPAQLANASLGLSITGYDENGKPIINKEAYTKQNLGLADSALDTALEEENLNEVVERSSEIFKVNGEVQKDVSNALKVNALEAKKAEKEFDDLTSVIKESNTALKSKDPLTRLRALDNIAKAARKAFGDNKKITSKFVEDNEKAFEDYANGVDGAEDRIRTALGTELANDFKMNEENASGLQKTIDNMANTKFNVDGTADFTDIFNQLLALELSAEDAASVLSSLGYTVTWVADGVVYDDINNVPIGSDYKVVVTDSAGNAVNRNRNPGGGGGGGGKKEFKNDFDKYYNMVEDINELQRLRNLLETDYEQLLKSEAISGKAIYDNLKKQIQLLKERRDITADLAEKRKGLIFETMNDKQYASVRKYAWWNDTDQTIEIDWNAINKVKDSERGDLIKEYVSKLEGFQSQYDEQIEALEDIESTLQEILKRGQEEYTSLEDRTRDALIKQIQDKIDELTAVDEAINDTNQKLMDSILKELEKLRQQRENAKTEEELADKEQRLAYLQQDSSGANALEIAKLQEELADARESYTDSLIDQKITELQEQNDEAAQQRQEQIDLMQQSLDWQEKSGAFWELVYEYIQAGTDEVGTLVHGSELENLLKAGEAWDSLSEEGLMKWLEELENQVAQAIGYLSLSRQLEEIGTKEGTKITFTDAEGNTHTGTVDKNGNVVVLNSDGSTTTWKDVYLSYDGSYQTLETQEDATTKLKPATNTGSNSSNNNKDKEPKKEPKKEPETTKTYALGKVSTDSVWVYPYESASGTYTKEEAEAKARAKNDATAEKLNNLLTDLEARWLDLKKKQREGKALTDDDLLLTKTYWKDKKDIEAKLKLRQLLGKGYKTGGLADYTGPAWLDGTPSKPELVLNARDTENFIQLKDHLAALRQAGTFNVGGDNYYDIDVHVDSLGSDYDVDMAIDRIKTRLYQDGAYRNVNTLNRLR